MKDCVSALSVRFKGETSMIVTPIVVVNPQSGERCAIRAMWDTGSRYCLISESLCRHLRLKFDTVKKVVTVNSSSHHRAGVVSVALCDDASAVPVSAILMPDIPGGMFEFVIGMNFIKKGEMLLSFKDHETVFSFMIPAKGSFDYVVQNCLISVPSVVCSVYECQDPDEIAEN